MVSQAHHEYDASPGHLADHPMDDLQMCDESELFSMSDIGLEEELCGTSQEMFVDTPAPFVHFQDFEHMSPPFTATVKVCRLASRVYASHTIWREYIRMFIPSVAYIHAYCTVVPAHPRLVT